MMVTEPGGLFGREIFSPAKLAARLQEGFDRDFGHLWVEGEISELSLPHSGHAYFSLKELAGGQEARLRAVMWKGRRAYAGSALAEGLMVLAKGRLAVYAPRGEIQLVVDYLEPRGEGALRLAFEKLKARLTAEGYFDEERKRPLPYWPAKVALVSSPDGAAARDFIRTARARRPKAAIIVYPVRVQGAGASREIAEAIGEINARGGCDLIVVTRGGGSLADLWAFNEAVVVEAVAASRTVVLAAVGHSTDLTLAELAADQMAITPTAAAEAVYRDQAVLLGHLAETDGRLARAMLETVRLQGENLSGLCRRLARELAAVHERKGGRLRELGRGLRRFEDRLTLAGHNLAALTARLERGAQARLADSRQRLYLAAGSLSRRSPQALIESRLRETSYLEDRLGRALAAGLERSRRRVEFLEARLKALSPEKILARGYALVTRGPAGDLVTGSDQVRLGEDLTIRLAKGKIISQVKDIL